MFTWIPIHREAIHRILEHPQNQKELLTILRDMEQQGLKVISLQDEGADGQAIPLAEIDPFSFLATFNRGVTEKNRRDNWAFLKTRWGLNAPVPDDFRGIPTLHNMVSRLFPYAKEREKDHVQHLWQIAELGAEGGTEKIDEASFDRCLKLKCVGIGSLSICLFWINPEKCLPADHKTTAYGKSKGVTTEPEDYLSYRQWLNEMTEKVGSNYPQVSHEAHLFAAQGKRWSFTKWMGPVLAALRALGGSGTPKMVQKQIQQTLKLSDAILADKNKSGQTKFYNEINWARQYLVWEALIESPTRGRWVLTEKGSQTALDEQKAQAIAEKWVAVHKQSAEEAPDDGIAKSPEEFTNADGDLHETPPEPPSTQYWTLAAGTGGKHWEEFCDKGIAAIGWDGTPDLRPLKDKEAIRKKLVKLWPGGSSMTNDALACWQFVHDIRIGDIIFAKRGGTKLLGYGLVQSDYEFDPARAYYKHVRKVKWLAKGEWEMPEESKLALKTLRNITPNASLVDLIAGKVGLEIGAEPRPVVVAPSVSTGVAYWWLNANPKIWNFEDTPVGQKQTYTSHNEKGNKRRIYDYFQAVKPGDMNPTRRISRKWLSGLGRFGPRGTGRNRSIRADFQLATRCPSWRPRASTTAASCSGASDHPTPRVSNRS